METSQQGCCGSSAHGAQHGLEQELGADPRVGSHAGQCGEERQAGLRAGGDPTSVTEEGRGADDPSVWSGVGR